MSEELRAIAEYLMDMADDIENGELTEHEWCSNKMGLDIEIGKLKEIAAEMSKHYD